MDEVRKAELTMLVRGTVVPITVTGNDGSYIDQGTFSAEVDGTTYRDKTFGGLFEILNDLTAGDTAVPFTYVRSQADSKGHWTVNGTARATHKSQHNVTLVTWPGGQKDSVGYRDQVLTPLTEDEADELDKLLTTQAKTAARIREIKAAHHIDLPAAVSDAMGARVGGEPRERE